MTCCKNKCPNRSFPGALEGSALITVQKERKDFLLRVGTRGTERVRRDRHFQVSNEVAN